MVAIKEFDICQVEVVGSLDEVELEEDQAEIELNDEEAPFLID